MLKFLPNRFVYSTLFFISLLIKVLPMNAQKNSLIDTTSLKEVIVQQDLKTNLVGMLSDKLTLNVEGVKTLPSLLGNTDMLKLLQLTPSVQTSGDANSNLYVRGGDPGQNLLLYNDNPIYSSGHMLSFFPLFNADHLSSIELLKSGVNAQYGGFISSTIVARSVEDLPQTLGIKGNLGLLSSQATLSVPIGKKWGAYLSGRTSYLQLILMPLLNITSNKKSEVDNMKYDFRDFNFTLIGQLSAQNKLVINAFSSGDNLRIDDQEIAINGELNWYNTTFSAKLETTIGDESKLRQYLIYSNYQNNLQTSQAEMAIHVRSQIEDIGYKNRLNYSLAGISFTSGLQYIHHSILPQETSMENAGIIFQNRTIGQSYAHDASIFTTANWRPSSSFYLEPGIRYNLYNSSVSGISGSKTFQSIDLRFAGRYQLNETHFLRASYSHNNQYVNKLTPAAVGLPTDFWVTAGSNILPQSGDEISAGYYQLIKNGAFELSSDIYYRRMRNVTEFNQNFLESESVPFTNKICYGKGTAYGIELMLKKNIGKFTGWLSYTLSRSVRKFDTLNHGTSFPAEYDRTHDLSLVTSYKFNDRWDASLVYIYATGNAYTQPSSWYFFNNTPVKDYDKYNGARMPNYNRTDISVNYWLKKDNGFNFSIYNMFGVKNPTYVFLLVKKNDTEPIALAIKQKNLLTIVPAISWRFKF